MISELVGEQDVDVAPDQVQELGPVPLDTERVRERQRHLAPGFLGDLRGLPERGLRFRSVEQIALEIDDLRRRRPLRGRLHRDPALG